MAKAAMVMVGLFSAAVSMGITVALVPVAVVSRMAAAAVLEAAYTTYAQGPVTVVLDKLAASAQFVSSGLAAHAAHPHSLQLMSVLNHGTH